MSEEARAPRTVPVSGCPVCGADGVRELFTVGDRKHGVPGRFRYARCAGCGSAYQSPRVHDDDIGLCYPGAYYTHREWAATDGPRRLSGVRGRVRERIQEVVTGRSSARGASVWRLLARLRWLRERAFFGLLDPLIPRSTAPGRALEVGTGSGWDLALLARAGWNVVGVEPDAEAAEVARRFSGRPVLEGHVHELIAPDERFELIYLSHVFEHLARPRRMMRFIRDGLRPDGRAVLVMPNQRSLGARAWGRDWYAWDPPRHLVLPSVRGLRFLAVQLGLGAAVSTRSRSATVISAESRSLRRRDEVGATPGPVDRGFRVVEAAANAAVGGLGEELVVVFTPRPGVGS